MLRQDYLMRMVEILTQALSRILFLRDAGRIDAAIDEIRDTARQLLGVDLVMVDKLAGDDTMALLGTGGHFDAAKCFASGMLLKLHAEIMETQDGEAATIRRFIKSLRLLTESILDAGNPLSDDHVGAIESLWHRVREYELPPGLQSKTIRALELSGRFDLAEDLLFDLLETDDTAVGMGIGMYERLLTKTDRELEQGNLPRTEVEESLAELKLRLLPDRSPSY